MSVKGANFGDSYEEQFRLWSLFCNFYNNRFKIFLF